MLIINLGMVKNSHKISLPKRKAKIHSNEELPLPNNHKNHNSSPQNNHENQIRTPSIKKIDIEDLASDSYTSEDCTDSDSYEYIHSTMEKIEYLVRANPDIRKIKGNRRSTDNIHTNNKTAKNLEKGLSALKFFVPEDVMDEYRTEGIDILPWPIDKAERNLYFSL
ncbi:unnamed protein product [Blepharisma stoltei]|uniref:Uncharacterized protein n=1 Tax=Blepharisma stoltei TaxID=1481888 RepID=A0AAU9KBC1_9CILI|nr:unnamed protein product [Blepharisma stoltei]